MNTLRHKIVYFFWSSILLFFLPCCAPKQQVGHTSPIFLTKNRPTLSAATIHTTTTQHTILVDDFAQQPDQGSAFWSSNRLGGDRGVVGSGMVDWGDGVVTATINTGTNTAVGVWTSLNHPIRDCTPINFAAVLPPQIESAYQGQVTEVTLEIADGQGEIQLLLQNGENSNCPPQQTIWTSPLTSLTGGSQTVHFSLPDTLTDTQTLVWQVIGDVGDFVTMDAVTLTAVFPPLPTAEQAFLWSYAMLLSNWNPDTGLTRDRADAAAGDFDNISAGGMQAAAAVQAWELGFISQAAAINIVNQTAAGLMALPRDPCGGNLWPHFVKNGSIIPGSEWSGIDSIIAAVSLLEAQTALGLDTTASEEMLTGIDWTALLNANGEIHHGFLDNCDPIEFGWRDFGTESWLVNFGMAAGTGETAVFDHTPPTANGSGFIDELAWLLLPRPCADHWLTNWCKYSETAVFTQLTHYQNYSCYANNQLFGLSAAEVPDRSAVASNQIYQAFGVGGKTAVNDGAVLLGVPVIVPHYAGMAAPLRPDDATALFAWLIDQGIFTPLNNVESLHLRESDNCQAITWNSLKGSWNLSLQTLGWGNALLGENNNPLFSSAFANSMLAKAYQTMTLTSKQYVPVILNQ